MSKLMRAGFSRLFRDKLFWAGIAVVVALGCFAGYTKYTDLREGFPVDLSGTLFSYCIISAFLLSVFTPLFVGTEYSDGVIRNKIIAGHKRRDIYLVNQLLSLATGICAILGFAVPHTLILYVVAGPSVVPVSQLLLYIGLSLLTLCAFSAIFNAIVLLLPRKAAAAVACMLVALGMLIAGLTIKARLDAPEYITSYSVSINGSIHDELEPNPKYLTGTKRAVYEFAYDVLPMGQNLQFLYLEVPHPQAVAGYAALLSVLVTLGGAVIFSKKDLK